MPRWRPVKVGAKCGRAVNLALAFPDVVDHLIYLFLLVVEVQRLHAALEVGRCEAFFPVKVKMALEMLSMDLKLGKTKGGNCYVYYHFMLTFVVTVLTDKYVISLLTEIKHNTARV